MNDIRMRAPHRLRTWTAIFVLLLIPLSTTGCGTLEVGLVRTATPSLTGTAAPSDRKTPVPTVTVSDLMTPEPTGTASPVQPTESPTGASRPDPASYLDVEREGGVLGGVWNLADLRYGLHPDCVQIVWEMVEARDHVPAFQVVEVDNAASPLPTGHDPRWGEARIDLVVSDVYARNSPVLEELPMTLPDDLLVTRVGSYPTFSDAHLGFSIGLKEPAAYEVYELTDPVRLVIAVFYPGALATAPRPTPASAPTPMPLIPTPDPHPSSTPVAPTMALTYTCTYPWFFANPPAECAGQLAIYSLTVAQHFERGLMLWRERPDSYGSQIYAFFADDKWPSWNPSNDRWRDGLPESDPTIIPPAGYCQPVRGFGLFWREAYFGTIGLSARDRLGWATEEGASLGELPMQCHAGDGYLPRCYVAGPYEVVYAVSPDNSWFVWQGPAAVPTPSTSPPITVPESVDCASEVCIESEPPQLYEARLAETAAGTEIMVIGSGGYLCWAGMCGLRYDESERSFGLILDGEPAGSLRCHWDHCEGTLDVPFVALLGTHTISVEGGSSLTIQVTGAPRSTGFDSSRLHSSQPPS